MRLEYIDNLKGFAIFTVIIGHLTERIYGCEGFNSFIYSFHMALFFFLSGYTNKINLSTFKESISFIKKRCRTLLLPYISFSLLGIIIHGYASTYSYFIEEARMGLWFLPTLFCMCLLLCVLTIISKMNIKKIIYTAIIIQIFLLLCKYYCNPTITQLFLIRHLTTYWIFFIIGIIFREKTIKLSEKMGACFISLFVIGWFISYKTGISNEIIRQIIRLIGTLSFIYLFKNEKLISKLRFFNYYGKNTLAIYILHYYFLEGIKSSLSAIEISSPLLLIILLCILSYIIAKLCLVVQSIITTNKYLSYIMLGIKG